MKLLKVLIEFLAVESMLILLIIKILIKMQVIIF